ncbi:MAG: hypothetical protein ACNS62_17020 [Candidatus Cyclobacteriaceae bacterium M3_2C_046]
MEIKKFRNKYDLELISAATENTILGCLVWDPLIGKPEFNHDGMPDHIFNAFLDADLMTETEWKKYLDDCRNEKEVEANFAERIIDVDVDLASTLDHPQIGQLSHSFQMKNVKKFTFGDLKARTMSNLLRVRIDDFLEELKKNNWEKYDGKIRRVFMITELYYGSLKLVIENSFKSELDASIAKTDLSLKNKLEMGKSVEYTFEHRNVPFAMRIEKVRKFNG